VSAGRPNDRERWDTRHMGADETDPAPSEFLVEYADRLPKAGRALDVACGRGRNAVWLARRGLTVDALDISTIGLAKAMTLAARHGVAERVRTIECDLKDGVPAPETAYDVVICLHFRAPHLWRELPRLVAPGGVLLVETLARDASNLDVDPDFLSERDELLEAARGLEVVFHGRAAAGRRAADRLFARRVR
jgi:2-polyprenyl-3-methyl-5-hydroxy-6-metoxy-1,4-benzoquinol methylase